MKSRNLMAYAASPSNPPKGYPLSVAVEVLKFRSKLWKGLHAKGLDIAEIETQISAKVLERFGPPS